MSTIPRLLLIFGIFMLSLTLINGYSIDNINPAFQRGEILAALSSIGLILFATIYLKFDTNNSEKAKLKGRESLMIKDSLPTNIKKELAWGSEMILTATAAATVLIYLKNEVILRRGLISDSEFYPQTICKKCMDSNKLISLVSTKFYPGKQEFDAVLMDLPAIIVCPLGNRGFIVIGGWKERCFTLSDEKWILGWASKLISINNLY